MKSLILTLGLLICFGTHASDAHAASALLSFSGQLNTAEGPVEGPVNITFSIFEASTEGTAIWADVVTVTADQGRVTATLGQRTNPIGNEVFTGEDRFLEIQVDGETLSPRLMITTVPYAIRADLAATTTDPTVQRRTPLNMKCPAGQLMRAIKPTGDVDCTPALSCGPVQREEVTNALTVDCHSGQFLTGGGCLTTNTNSIQNSRPNGNGWACNLQGSTPASVTAYAMCCRLL